MANKIRVLVVDDSALMRKKISDMINSDEGLEVIGTACDGEEAVREVMTRKPDVITMDIKMPGMDGLTALGYIMSERPTPTVMLSAYTKFNSVETIKALEYGAVDFVLKPGGVVSLEIEQIKAELLRKIKIASAVNINKIKVLMGSAVKRKKPQPSQTLDKLVIIGASTGGPRALSEIIPRLSGKITAAVLVIQHMPKEFTGSLASRLDYESELKVKEAEEGEEIKPGKVLLAPGDRHLLVREKGGKHFVSLNTSPHIHGVRPSISVTMNSAAPLYGRKAIGVILTGMGSDGVEGMSAIRQHGGKTLAEDQSTVVVNGMPKAAIEQQVVDKVVPLYDMAREIERLAALS